MKYDKQKGSGEGQIVGFVLKEEHITLLNELQAGMPDEFSRSDLLRSMVLPYMEALTLAKEGKPWLGALEFGKGLVRMKKMFREEEQRANQQELDFDRSVSEVPANVIA